MTVADDEGARVTVADDELTYIDLVGADWSAMHEQAAVATTVADADRTIVRYLDGTVEASMDLWSRRAVFALARHPLCPDWWQVLAADPLLREMRVGGFAADGRGGSPAWLMREITWAPWGRAHCHVDSIDGRHLATVVVFGPEPLVAAVVGVLPDASDAELAAHIVETVRVRGLPGGRPPGRPPGTKIALDQMSPKKKMQVAVELCETGKYSQAAAAIYAGVRRDSVNRALHRRRRERLMPPGG